MILRLSDLLFKKEKDRYIGVHNSVRHIIEDEIGTTKPEVIDRIMFVILKEYNHDM